MGSRRRYSVDTFFEHYFEVSPPSSRDVEPAIVYSFPDNCGSTDLLRSAVKFVYPFKFSLECVQHFSFVLTDSESKFTYGYCRHDLENDNAMAFVSYLPNTDDFNKYLDEIGLIKRKYRQMAKSEEIPYTRMVAEIENFLKNIYKNPIDTSSPYVLPRIPDNRNLTDYFSAIDPQAMVGMLGALLHERRIIVRSSRPFRLSGCVRAVNDLLYPLMWQHIFIPVLPNCLIDYLSAPMPYLIGVSNDMFMSLSPSEIGEVAVLNADGRNFTSPFDDLSTLSVDIQTGLRRTIKTQGFGEDTVSRAFLKAIVQIIGGYEDAIKLVDGNLFFDPDIFLTGCKSSMRNFRTQLLMTQIFQQFIEERLSRIVKGNTRSDEFEREYAMWETARAARLSVSGPRRISASAADLLRSVKERTQPAVENAVESVRQEGRKVKHVFQEIKSRIETTSHNTRSKLRRKKNESRPSSRLSGNVDTMNIADETNTLSVSNIANDFMTQSLDFAQISPAAGTSTPRPAFESYIRGSGVKSSPSFSMGSPPPALSPFVIQFPPRTPITDAGDLIQLDSEPSGSGNTASGWRSPKTPTFMSHLQPNGKSTELIQLDDEKPSESKQRDTDLLGEYGIDFEKFKISRDNWTKFD